MLGVSTRRVDDLVRPWASTGSAGARSRRICAALDAEVERVPGPAAGRDRLPVPLARCDVPQGARGRPGRVDGGARRGRGASDRRALDPRARARRRATTRVGLAGASSGGWSGAASTGYASSCDDHAGLVRAVHQRAARLGLAAVPGPLHPQRPGPRAALGAEHGRLGHPVGVRAARRRLGPGAARPGDRRPAPGRTRRSPSCSPRPRPTCSPTSRSPRPTAAGSARRTRSSGSTRRSRC